MKKELKVGDTGYLAWLDAYVLHVEFLGFGHYQPDYPGDPTRYYRALSSLDQRNGDEIEPGDIVDEHNQCDEELFETPAEAANAVIKSRIYWLGRKREEVTDMERQINDAQAAAASA